MKFIHSILYWFRPPRKISITKEGWIFILLSFPVGLAAINTGNNMLYLVLGMLLSIIALNGFLSESTIKKIFLQFSLPGYSYVESHIGHYIEVKNQKRHFPSYLLRITPFWDDKTVSVFPGFLVKLQAGESLKSRITSQFEHRGIFHLKFLRISTRFPFGLFEKSRKWECENQMIIYPKPEAFRWESQGHSYHLGDLETSQKGQGEDFYSLREYLREDDARHIHWKSSAKTGQPMLREFSRSGVRRVVIVFDPYLEGEDQESLEKFERVVSHVAYLVEKAYENQMEVGLYTPDQKFSPNQGEPHFHRLMQHLAIITPSKKKTNFSIPFVNEEVISIQCPSLKKH